MRKLLSDEDIEVLKRDYWSKLDHDVKLIYISSRDKSCQYCEVIRQLYEELDRSSEKIKLYTFYFEDDPEWFRGKYKIIRPPVVYVSSKNRGSIKFYGLPSGLEFSSFVEALVIASTLEVDLPRSIIEEIYKIEEEVNIKVFVTPSCPYCPRMVSLSYMFAALNEHIDAEAIESLEFPEIAEKYRVATVPKVVINDRVYWEGLVPPETLLRYIQRAIRRTR